MGNATDGVNLRHDGISEPRDIMHECLFCFTGVKWTFGDIM